MMCKRDREKYLLLCLGLNGVVLFVGPQTISQDSSLANQLDYTTNHHLYLSKKKLFTICFLPNSIFNRKQPLLFILLVN